jgi:hypothetical protein
VRPCAAVGIVVVCVKTHRSAAPILAYSIASTGEKAGLARGTTILSVQALWFFAVTHLERVVIVSSMHSDVTWRLVWAADGSASELIREWSGLAVLGGYPPAAQHDAKQHRVRRVGAVGSIKAGFAALGQHACYPSQCALDRRECHRTDECDPLMRR